MAKLYDRAGGTSGDKMDSASRGRRCPVEGITGDAFVDGVVWARGIRNGPNDGIILRIDHAPERLSWEVWARANATSLTVREARRSTHDSSPLASIVLKGSSDRMWDQIPIRRSDRLVDSTDPPEFLDGYFAAILSTKPVSRRIVVDVGEPALTSAFRAIAVTGVRVYKSKTGRPFINPSSGDRNRHVCRYLDYHQPALLKIEAEPKPALILHEAWYAAGFVSQFAIHSTVDCYRIPVRELHPLALNIIRATLCHAGLLQTSMANGQIVLTHPPGSQELTRAVETGKTPPPIWFDGLEFGQMMLAGANPTENIVAEIRRACGVLGIGPLHRRLPTLAGPITAKMWDEVMDGLPELFPPNASDHEPPQNLPVDAGHPGPAAVTQSAPPHPVSRIVPRDGAAAALVDNPNFSPDDYAYLLSILATPELAAAKTKFWQLAKKMGGGFRPKDIWDDISENGVPPDTNTELKAAMRRADQRLATLLDQLPRELQLSPVRSQLEREASKENDMHPTLRVRINETLERLR